MAGRTVGLVSGGYAEGFLNVYGPESSFGLVLAAFGAANAVDATVTDLSPEQAGVLAGADTLVVLDFTGLGGDPLADFDLVTRLPAVESGSVVPLTEDESYAIQGQNPIRLPAAIDVAARIAGV